MKLKHANEIQRDLPINKHKKQLEDWKLAEELLFERIEESQKEGKTYCSSIEGISQTTIDKLKALDYVIKRDDWGIYIIDWGKDRHKKSWFGG